MNEIWGSEAGTDTAVHRDVHWLYPIINDTSNLSRLTLYLSHVRAADPIRIAYDGSRDGWVIEQASKFSWDADDEVCDMDWQEVAFIKAWAREKE